MTNPGAPGRNFPMTKYPMIKKITAVQRFGHWVIRGKNLPPVATIAQGVSAQRVSA
jgi:hypothetical protein